MNRLERWAILVRLIETLRESGSWCSETHVQKATYFLKRLLKVPLEFDFILYKHGTYSFDLRAELTALRAYSILELEPHSQYGPSICPGDNAEQLEKHFARRADRYARKIKFVAEKFGSKGVVELERLSTALYVTVEEQESRSAKDRASRITELKPHVSIRDARDAVREVDEIIKEAEELLHR